MFRGVRECVKGQAGRLALKYKSELAGVAKTASATLAFVELFDQLKVRLHYRHQHQLSDTLADGDVEGGLPRFQHDTISSP